MIMKLICLFSTLLYIPVLYPVVGGRNAVQAERLFRRRFPDKPSPSRRMFGRLTSRLRETGSLNPRPRHRPRTRTDECAEVAVLATIAVNPHISTRQIEREVGVSKSSAQRILKRHKFHPYHVHLHQDLHGNDFSDRVTFCRWAQQQLLTNPNFFADVLFTDEASFSNKGIVNMRNMHYWSADNPKWLRQVEHQRPWKVNVWCGIIGDTIIGPFFVDGIQNGRQYSRFIRHNLPVLLDTVPLNRRMVMWYQHDGCPAHNDLRARRLLNRKFPGRWIGRGGPVRWPARSPDLTPMDFFLWGAVKDAVYQHAPTTPEDMKQRIIAACTAIKEETVARSRASFIRRVTLCMQANGHHFEHEM